MRHVSIRVPQETWRQWRQVLRRSKFIRTMIREGHTAIYLHECILELRHPTVEQFVTDAMSCSNYYTDLTECWEEVKCLAEYRNYLRTVIDPGWRLIFITHPSRLPDNLFLMETLYD